MKNSSNSLVVKGTTIRMQNDFISLTDMCAGNEATPDALIERWLRQKYTVEYIGKWELLHNPEFKPPEFEGFYNQAGSNTFYLSVRKWVEATGAVGIVSKKGRGGGTFPDLIFKALQKNSPLGAVMPGGLFSKRKDGIFSFAE